MPLFTLTSSCVGFLFTCHKPTYQISLHFVIVADDTVTGEDALTTCLFYNKHRVTFEAILYLEAVFASPPARVLFRRHVYDGHNVPHLRSTETDGENKVDSNSRRLYEEIINTMVLLISFREGEGYLKGQLVCGLGRVSLGDVGSSDGRDVDGGLLRHQQMVPFVVNLETQNSNISKYLAF